MQFDLLRDVRIVDLSTEIAGPYATKLLVDAGADVVKIEPKSGDPLRRWTASGGDLQGEDGALFRFLNAGKRSIVSDVSDDAVTTLLDGADALVESGQLSLAGIEGIRRARPALPVISISPYGRRGPWSERPATEFTLQAQCGTIVSRGLPEREPLHIGGRLGEWAAGAYTAIAVLAAVHQRRRSGAGDHVDVSMLECMCASMGGMQPLSASLGGVVRSGPVRSLEMPSIEPTADGYVGVCCNTAQHFADFLAMIGRQDLQDDDDLASFVGRWTRRDEFWSIIHAWTRQHTTAHIVELANLMRIPTAPVASPDDLRTIDHFEARKVFCTAPDGEFVVPRTPYQVDGQEARPATRAPKLGEHAGTVDWAPRDRTDADPDAEQTLPLAGLRVLDFTTFWAGPSATKILAALGADVIHIESIQRPDGYRFITMRTTELPEQWWERSVGYQLENVNKRGITLNVGADDGRELLLRLIEHCDAFVENYTPRVMATFGISADVVRQHNPSAIIMRMPAFGLSGPWRDRSGFASTMEAATGLAWLTGYADGPPTTLRGPLDAISGTHAAFAMLATLHERQQSGASHFIESPMIEVALNVAAELVIEHSAYGVSLRRDGNRGPCAAPQGIYACRGDDQWLALAVANDDQWDGLRKALGDPDWTRAGELDSVDGRRRHHDEIDRRLHAWAAAMIVDEAVDVLLDHGVPAAAVTDGLQLLHNEQLQCRGYYEPISTQLLGSHHVPSQPFRFASRTEPWIRRAAPTLGEHNREILGDLLGLTGSDLDDLEARDVIGVRPLGV